MEFGLVAIPASNCDHDGPFSVAANLGEKASCGGIAMRRFPTIFTPSIFGFYCGDSLRCCAIAEISSLIGAGKAVAGKGGLVIEIGNGIRILTESGLLSGGLVRNTKNAWFTGRMVLSPNAHAKCRYTVGETSLVELEAEDRVPICPSEI